MPYVKPSAEDFFERFPIFADKDSDAVERLIDEAAGQIDRTWREADYQPAILYLTAHLIATDNSGSGEEVEVGARRGPIASESFPGMSISYTNSSPAAGSVASSEAYGTTEYGRRFLLLAKKNRGGPVVI